MWGDPRRVLSAHSRPRLVAATRSVTTRNVTHPTIFFDFQSTRPPQGGLCVFALGMGRGPRADAWWAWVAAGRAAVDRRQGAGRGRAAFVAAAMRSRCGPASCQNATPVGAPTPAWRAGAPNAVSARCLFMVVSLLRAARPGRPRFGLGFGRGLRVWSSDLRTSATRSRPGAAWFTATWFDRPVDHPFRPHCFPPKQAALGVSAVDFWRGLSRAYPEFAAICRKVVDGASSPPQTCLRERGGESFGSQRHGHALCLWASRQKVIGPSRPVRRPASHRGRPLLRSRVLKPSKSPRRPGWSGSTSSGVSPRCR